MCARMSVFAVASGTVPWSLDMFVECCAVQFVSAVESEHVCGKCCGVWSVKASGDVFAESVLMSGLTKNTWRVT